jgi:hypothetical protein
MAAALGCFLAAANQIVAGAPAHGAAVIGTVLLVLLCAERTYAGIRAWRRFGDPAGLAFPFVHLLRDVAWVSAVAVWLARRMLGRPRAPGHSMRARASL